MVLPAVPLPDPDAAPLPDPLSVPPVDPPVVPPVDPPVVLPDDPPVVPPTEPLVPLPGATASDEPLPTEPEAVLPLDPATPFLACPGGTPVRDAASSLWPGVRPPSRDAALPLLPGERFCTTSLSLFCIEPLLDMPVELLDVLLAASDKPETLSVAATAMANAVFLILNLQAVGLCTYRALGPT